MAQTERIVGIGRGLKTVMERVGVVAPNDVPVLLLGETGTGKEVVARAIHEGSHRAGPVWRVNCGAVAPDLIDSELFGHERGAFTGAAGQRKGWFEQAHDGTLFLDEVGELTLAAQVRLLRVLQEGELVRVGGEKPVSVDVRIVAATHRDLGVEVRAGRFRADLFYRLHVLALDVPPLRERLEDLPVLAAHILRRLARRDGLEVRAIGADALGRLGRHSWPGNVRELEAVLTRAAHIAGPGGVIEADALGADFTGEEPLIARDRHATLRGRTLAYEAELIRGALDAHRGNRSRAARSLGLTRQGLWKKMRRLGALLPPD